MRLNSVEKYLVNSPLRAWLQKKIIREHFRRMRPLPPNNHVLEVGCGRGMGIDLLKTYMRAEKVDAFDADPDMLDLAESYLKKRKIEAKTWHGRVTAISTANNTYDAVFDFGVLHHVPDWRGGIHEIRRVLKPGGAFYLEEYYRKFITHPLAMKLLRHPTQNRFSHEELIEVLKEEGFEVIAHKHYRGLAGCIVAIKKTEIP